MARPSNRDLLSKRDVVGKEEPTKCQTEDEDEAVMSEEEVEDKEEEEDPCRKEELSTPSGHRRGLSEEPNKLPLSPEPRRGIGYHQFQHNEL